ncbi:MAG TPA: lipocalin family protein [Chryseosolibacter sp.]
MKKYISYVVALLVVTGSAISFSACDGNDGPSASEKQMKLLVGTWNISSVKVDGVDYTNIFDGFKLTFTDAPPTYSPVNGGKVWTEPGQFTFTDGAATQFFGPAGQVVTITTLTENALVLELVWNETSLGMGRTKSIAGNHEFVFTR